MATRMTEAGHGRPRQPRLSRKALRTWAWTAGAIAFFTPWAVLGGAPKPADASQPSSPRRVIVVRRITRRVVVHERAESAPVRYVYTGGGGSSAPAPAPVSSTGGS